MYAVTLILFKYKPVWFLLRWYLTGHSGLYVQACVSFASSNAVCTRNNINEDPLRLNIPACKTLSFERTLFNIIVQNVECTVTAC